MINFSIAKKKGNLRRGQLFTQHGQVQTPAIFPWAINGCLSGLSPSDCCEIGIQGLAMELLPLTVHPGIKSIMQAGGLHRFFSWHRPILTMAANFPESDRLKSNAAQLGLRYQAPYTRAYKRITAADAQKISQAADADLQIPLFQEVNYFAPVDDLKKSVQVNLQWQEAAKSEWRVSLGGGLHDLRSQMLKGQKPQAVLIANLPEDDSAEYQRILNAVIKQLPEDSLRAAAVADTEELCIALEAGVDLVLWKHPLKDADHGITYHNHGPLVLSQAEYENVSQPLFDNYQPSFLHYLMHEKTPAGNNILSRHNLSLLVSLMKDWRESIGSTEENIQFDILRKSICLASQW